MKKYVSLILVLVGVLTFSTVADAKAKKAKKAPEFSITSVKQITAVVAEINQTENFILIREDEKGKNKKVLIGGAVILKVTDSGVQVGALTDLLKDQKAHMWVAKKLGANKAYNGLVITQFLGAKALASQPPVAQFALSSSQGLENAGPSLVVSLSKAFASDVRVSYTVSGTATVGADYALANGDIVVAAGQTTGIIPLIVVDDSAQESDETVVVTLTAATNATLGTQKIHTYTIQDNDQTRVGFASATASGAENTTSVNMQVALETVSLKEVSVSYTVSGTATGSGTDYTLANGTAVIPAGQTTANITATVVDDSLIESSETIIVTLSNPLNATLSSNTVHTYTITDNDQPTVSFGSASSAGLESVATVLIPVSLSTSSVREARVNYTVTGTAAGSEVDYTLANGTVTFPAGQTTTNISLAVVNDTTDELDETVVITLSGPTDAALGGTSVYTYTIQDNDNPTVSFTAPSSSGGENVTPVSVGLTFSAAPVADAQVTYTVTGTATGGGTDYTLANGTLTVTAGQLTGNISLAIVDDVIVDANETVIITISSPTNSSLGTNTVYTYTINDND